MVRRVVHGHDQVLPAASSRYGHGDSDGPGRAPSVGAELGYRTRASLPFGATLRGSPGAGEGWLRPHSIPLGARAPAEFAVGARAPSAAVGPSLGRSGRDNWLVSITYSPWFLKVHGSRGDWLLLVSRHRVPSATPRRRADINNENRDGATVFSWQEPDQPVPKLIR